MLTPTQQRRRTHNRRTWKSQNRIVNKYFASSPDQSLTAAPLTRVVNAVDDATVHDVTSTHLSNGHLDSATSRQETRVQHHVPRDLHRVLEVTLHFHQDVLARPTQEDRARLRGRRRSVKFVLNRAPGPVTRTDHRASVRHGSQTTSGPNADYEFTCATKWRENIRTIFF